MASGLMDIVQRVNSVPGDITTKANLLAQEAIGLLAMYTGQIDLVPESASTTVSAPGATQAAGEVEAVVAAGGRVPPDASTTVSAPGAPETQTALEQIISQAEKTKIPVVVKVTSPGAEEAVGKLRDLKTALQNIGDGIPAAVNSFDRLKSGIKSAVSEAVSEMKSAVGKFKSSASEAGKGAVAGMKSGIQGLDQAARAEASRAVGVMRGMVGQFGSVGAAMGSAVRSSFQSAISGLAAAAAAQVSAALAAARAAASASPFPGAFKNLGEGMGRGVVMGFLLGTRDLPSTASEEVRKALEAIRTTVEGFQSKMDTAFGDLISNALSGFDRITSEHLTKTEQLIADMQLDKQITDLAARVEEAKARLHEAMASGDQDAIIAAQKALDDAMYDQEMFNLQRQAEAERKAYEDRRELQRRHMEEQLQGLMERLAKHPEEHDKIQRKIIALLKRYGLDYRGSGINVGLAIAEGLRESIPAVTNAAQAVAQAIANGLKAMSPTKEGPMSDLDHWLDNFAPTYLKGLDKERIRKALMDATRLPAPGAFTGATISTAIRPMGPLGSSTPFTTSTIIVNVAGSVTTEDDLAAKLRATLISKGQGLTRTF